MKIKKVESGIHTIELYACNLKYSQVQKILDRQSESGTIFIDSRDDYNVDHSAKFYRDGIRFAVHQSHNKSNGTGFIFSPSSLLEGQDMPLALYKPGKDSCHEIQCRVENAMHKIGLETNNYDGELVMKGEDLSLSQMDLTMNLWFDKDVDLTEIIRLFSKGNIPEYFKRYTYSQKKYGDINRYCFIMKSKGITFKVYDKIHELKDNNRGSKKLQSKNVLRIEVSIKRKEFIRKFELDKDDSLHKMLKTGYKNLGPVIVNYAGKIFPCHGKHIRYDSAKKAIEHADIKPKIKKQMLFLLEKTSDGDGLDTALEKLKKEYKIKDQRTVKNIYTSFDKLEINPITLRNDSSIKEMPCILDMIQEVEKQID